MRKVIPLTPLRQATPLALPPASVGEPAPWRDTRERPLRDLRISVTDRCNFRCTYCMPRDVFDRDYPFLPQRALLSFEEIARLAAVFVAQGVNKLRITGGEPLMRKNLTALIRLLAELRTPEGEPVDLTLTTNGSLLAAHAAALRDAGLRRVTVSLDALDPDRFAAMSDTRVPVSQVLQGIEAAARAGLAPVKVNMVVKRGVNEDQILPMARHFRGSGHILRFIEFMDVGATNGWRLDDVVTGADIVSRIARAYPLASVAPAAYGEVARRWRYEDGAGEIGVITSVSHAFCGACTRARLSPEGLLYLCLFAHQGHDLRALLRAGASDAQLAEAVGRIWRVRDDNYSEQRSLQASARPRIEMSYIGG